MPGNAAQSILVYRQLSNDPAVRMPELGRSSVHTQGVDLVTSWINSLPATTCTTAQ